MSVNTGLKINSQLRGEARERLKGNWLQAVLVVFLSGIIMMILGWVPFLGAIYSLVVSGPVMFGLALYFLKLKRSGNPILEDLFAGFKLFMPCFILYLLIALFTFLWALLLIVPGIIASLRYSMAFFVLTDNPGISAQEALNRSKEMMKGRCGKLFLLMLSFIGWAILAVIPVGLGFLWLMPYVQASLAAFYEDLKNAAVTENPSVIPSVTVVQ